MGLFKPSKSSWSELFFKNWDLSLLMWNFMGKNRKNWWSRDLALQTNGKTNKDKLIKSIGHSCQVSVQLIFAPRRRYSLSVAVWWYFRVDFGSNYLYHKAWYKLFLDCLMGIDLLYYTLENHQLGTKATKMATPPQITAV